MRLLRIFPKLSSHLPVSIEEIDCSCYFSFQQTQNELTINSLGKIASSLVYRPFPKAGPFWHIYFVSSADKATTACFFVIHHMLCDGLGLLQIVHQLAAADKHSSGNNSPYKMRLEQPSNKPKMPSLNEIALITRQGLTRTTTYGLSGTNSAKRRFAFLPETPAGNNFRNNSLSIKLLTASTSGLRNFLLTTGTKPSLPTNAILPVAASPLPQRWQLGNRFVSMPVRLPIHLDDEKEQTLWLQQQLRLGTEKKQLDAINRVFNLLYRLPKTVQQQVFPKLCRKAALHTTLIPVSLLKRRPFFFSQRCLHFYPLLSPPPGMSLSFGVVFSGTSFLPSLTWDPALIKDGEKLISAFNDSCRKHLR